MDQLVEKAENFAQEKAGQVEEDISLQEAYKDFIDQELDGEEPHIRDSVIWKLKI